jgi:hypothetical protein
MSKKKREKTKKWPLVLIQESLKLTVEEQPDLEAKLKAKESRQNHCRLLTVLKPWRCSSLPTLTF